MKEHKRRWPLVLIAFAAITLSAWAEEIPPAEIFAPDEPTVEQKPSYSVEVTRSGKTLRIAIITESREQRDALFGQRWEHKPSIEIYKGDLLLESGSFAFG